jgi:DNA-binding transcriptional regulator YiaG
MPEVIGCGVNSVNSSHLWTGRQEKTGKDRPGQIGPVKTRYDTAKNKLKPNCPATLRDGYSGMKSKIRQLIGRRICRFRHQHSVSQAELAAMLNTFHPPITRDVVANWETGRTEAPAYCIQLIAFSLEAKVADILPDLSFKEIIVGQMMDPSGSRRRNRQPT